MPLIRLEQAWDIIARHVQAGATEKVALDEALGRVTAQPVVTDIDDPPFDRATMDGFAVRAADTLNPPVRLAILGQINAGADLENQPLAPGQAWRINTGAPMPPGADAVVRIEDTEVSQDGASVTVNSQIQTGKFVTPRAAHIEAGATIIGAGRRLSSLDLAAAGAGGAAELTVYTKPSAALLVTGDELVSVADKPSTGQIRNSNQYLLAGLMRTCGINANVLGVVGDDADLLAERIRAGLAGDFLCLTGGVSMGTLDLVPAALQAWGVETRFHKVAIKPGRPTLFGTAGSTLVFALPGNPVSCLMGFELFVRPAIAAREGLAWQPPRFERATLEGKVPANGGDRLAFRPGKIEIVDDGGVSVVPSTWHGSGDVFGLAGADALIVRPPGSPVANTGEMVSILRLSGL